MKRGRICASLNGSDVEHGMIASGGLVQMTAYESKKQDTLSAAGISHAFDSVGHLVGLVNKQGNAGP